MSIPVMIALFASFMCSLSIIWRAKDKNRENHEEMSGTQKFLGKGWIWILLFAGGLVLGLVSGLMD